MGLSETVEMKRWCSKALVTVAALMLISVASIVSVTKNNVDAEDISGYSAEEFNNALAEQYALLSEKYDGVIMDEFGMTYLEYNQLMNSLSGKAISITTVDGEIVAEIIESIDKGKTMIDSEFRGDQFRVYIDTVTMAGLAGLEGAALTTAIGAIIGSAFSAAGSPIGATAGLIIGLSSSAVIAALHQLILEQLELDNGIWIDITIRGHFTMFGNTIYYMLPSVMWRFSGMGPQ